jgi:hypothetical protein
LGFASIEKISVLFLIRRKSYRQKFITRLKAGEAEKDRNNGNDRLYRNFAIQPVAASERPAAISSRYLAIRAPFTEAQDFFSAKRTPFLRIEERV